MMIALLGAGHIGSTVGRLWHAAGHEVTFAARDAEEPHVLADDLGDRAHAATVADAVAAADVVLVAVRSTAAVDVLAARRRGTADLGRIDDSQFQEPGSALWNTTLEDGEAGALAGRVRAGEAAAADPLTAPFEKLRDHAPDDPAFFSTTSAVRSSRPGSAGGSSQPSGTRSGRRSTASTRSKSHPCSRPTSHRSKATPG